MHDHLFSKGGIAASSSHVLRQSVERHKARLQAEFTKARLRWKCATVEALKEKLVKEKTTQGFGAREQPRWVRINRLKTTEEDILENTLNGYRPVTDLSGVLSAGPGAKVFWRDLNVPDLLALPPGTTNLTKTKAYVDGKIVLQDKASCFPAQLLLGSDAGAATSVPYPSHGDIMDACAAPGNKTTHLSVIIDAASSTQKTVPGPKIFACERDAVRSKLLDRMVKQAGATNISVLAKQDFLALDISDPKFANVTHLLLDPSCSGSGIIGREDVPTLALPTPPSRPPTKPQNQTSTNAKKRKRSQVVTTDKSREAKPVEEEYTHQPFDKARLEKLSNLQSRIIEHAFSFPAATRITYSTCSIHAEENEQVVARVLQSAVAHRRSWTLLPRSSQVDGLKKWKLRGVRPVTSDMGGDSKELSDQELDACIRCHPGDDEGTMGFFVCGFVREGNMSDSDVVTEKATAVTATGGDEGDGGEDFGG